ncbi:MAG: hypothetical protein E7271_08630 [Lachnospiraceae bacterium]|nr:hypothetical protein [Lachnospiraceae bacterium]
MTEQTLNLLDKVNEGCKMAINSMKQVKEFVEDDKLDNILKSYTLEHERLEKDTGDQLARYGKTEDRPNIMASAMSWISTEAKLLIKDDASQIAKIIMDGCNMGIQSVSEYLNKYDDASPESVHLAKKLIKTEEDLMCEMKAFV